MGDAPNYSITYSAGTVEIRAKIENSSDLSAALQYLHAIKQFLPSKSERTSARMSQLPCYFDVFHNKEPDCDEKTGPAQCKSSTKGDP